MAKAPSVKAQMIKTKGANDKQPRFHIQSGVLKHLKLIWNAKSSTRPTKSIVKESFFNTMKSEIVDCVFIEGFGGCGSMGIEALSLGASEAVFYEIDTEAYKILCQNLTHANNAAHKLGKRAPIFLHKALFIRKKPSCIWIRLFAYGKECRAYMSDFLRWLGILSLVGCGLLFLSI